LTEEHLKKTISYTKDRLGAIIKDQLHPLTTIQVEEMLLLYKDFA